MADGGKQLVPISYRKLPTPIATSERVSTSREFSDLPNLLAEIAEVVGREAALDISYVKGGRRCYFPAHANDDHWLVRTVGREKADALCKYFCVNHKGGVSVVLPIGQASFYAQAKIRAVEMRRTGQSIATVARILGVTTRAVEKWYAAADGIAQRLATNLPPLFDRNRIEDDP